MGVSAIGVDISDGSGVSIVVLRLDIGVLAALSPCFVSS